MFTNRDEVLEKALRIFAKMNYEKASQMEIAKTCGLSKAGLTYYFPFKLDLFMAVADRYVFDTQHSKNKFNFTDGSLTGFCFGERSFCFQKAVGCALFPFRLPMKSQNK